MFLRYLILLVFVRSISVEGLRWETVNDLDSECRKTVLGDNSTSEKPVELVKERILMRASRETQHPITMNWAAQMEKMAKMAPELEKKVFYCTFTKLGLLDAKGNIVWKSLDGDKGCNTKCLQYLANCSMSTDAHDIYTTAFINANCAYVSSWAVTGFV